MRDPDEPTTDADAPALPEEPRTNPDNPTPARSFPVPWGLFVALGIYGLAVLGYVWATYWRSADYQAAMHYQDAWALLGRDEGRKSSREQLTEAYRHLLEAARLKPEVKTFHDDLESLNWRFEERKWQVPGQMRHASEAVAMLWQRIQQERKPILVVGLRDKGWAPEQLVAGPATVAKWSPVPALFIVAIWAYGRFSAKRVRDQEKEEDALKQEVDLVELGRFRDGLEQRKSGSRPAVQRRSGTRPRPK